MSDVFVVQNQLGQYWGKKKTWADGTDPKRVVCCAHEDEAVNLLVELSARDIDLRGEVSSVSTNERGVPQVVPSEHLIPDEPPPLEDSEADENAATAVVAAAAPEEPDIQS